MCRRNDVVMLGLLSALSVTACGGGSFSSNPGAGGEAGFAGDATGGTGTGGATHTGGTGTGGILGGAPIPLDQYPTAVGNALCPPLSGCCATLGIALTTDQCKTTLLSLGDGTATADPANYTYDPLAAGVCIAAAGNAFSSSCTTSGESNTDPFCSNVFTGALAPGEPCTNKIECAHQAGDTVSCEELVTGAGTVCVLERRVLAGQPCYWTCTEQAGGFRICSGSGGTQTAVQGRCYTNDGLYCTADGVCEPRGRIGDACSGSDSCAEGYCDFSTSLCTVKAAQGGACTSNDGCTENLYCKSQICTPDLPAGSACTYADRCLNGSCQNSVCVANTASPDQLGMALLCAFLNGALQTQ